MDVKIRTRSRSDMVEVTPQLRRAVEDAGLDAGRVVAYVPHTTAGITINENADPDVAHDMLAQLDAMVPWSQPFYRHGEGNAAAHVKASLMGSSVTLLVEAGQLVLGTWQGVYLCEFDGPRTRRLLIDAR